MSNKAAWIPEPKARLTVGDAPMPQPGPGEVVIRNYAVAINPVDTAMQDLDRLIQSYPSVLGSDCAGEITAVGSDVKGFAVGDRVVGTCNVIEAGKAAYGAFQLYSAAATNMVGKIPQNTSYTEAAVFGMGMNTAAAGLYQKENLNLPLPQEPRVPNGKTLLVWGASSSVGASALQMAVASGFDVAATAGKANLHTLKGLGAKWAFDHSSETVVEDVVNALKGAGEFGGAFDSISKPDSLEKCGKIIPQLGGNQFLESVLPKRVERPEGLAASIGFGKVWGLAPASNEIGPAVWQGWVHDALKAGTLKSAPQAEVVGQGLEHVQAALDRWKQGVSGRKIVVELP